MRVDKAYRSTRSKLADPDKLAKVIELATVQRQPDVILVLFDAHDDCPAYLSKSLNPVCEGAQKRTAFVAANGEYEAWFLSTVASLRKHPDVKDDAECHAKPEEPRNAKGELSRSMTKPYSETLHQEEFSEMLDLDEASQHCRSFQRLRAAVSSILGM